MIPRKIHYCWLSGEPMPKNILKCMKTWKDIMPGYELVLWDKNKFDINAVPFVSEACSVRKWAFAADYIRLYALHTEGGIYLDTDVIIKKDLSEFLFYDFFTGIEYHHEIKNEEDIASQLKKGKKLKNPAQRCVFQAAIMGASPGNPFLKECLDWYRDKHFILGPGKYHIRILAPDIYTMLAAKHGFRNVDELQMLHGNMAVFPSYYFSWNIADYTKETYAIHWCEGSWRSKISFWKIYLSLTRSNYLRKFLGKKPLKIKTLDDVIRD
jgi:hypothetical protein